MHRALRRVAAIAVLALMVTAAAAGALAVKIGPVRGATYVGDLHGEQITIRVARSGRSATVRLPIAPAFCPSGSGPEIQGSVTGRISRSGELTLTASYLSPSNHRAFATVTVQANFYRFGSATPVAQGTVRTTFRAAPSCDGQESFQAVKG